MGNKKSIMKQPVHVRAATGQPDARRRRGARTSPGRWRPRVAIVSFVEHKGNTDYRKSGNRIFPIIRIPEKAKKQILSLVSYSSIPQRRFVPQKSFFCINLRKVYLFEVSFLIIIITQES